jgi:CHAD domain-containing protein
MNGLKKYLKKRKESIITLLKKPRHLYTPNTFHDLRVEIKKLKAIHEIINFCSPEFKSNKVFKPHKQIFKQAGKVRDIHIEEAMLKKYFNTNLLKEYRSDLRGHRLKEQDNYFSILNKKSLTKLNKTYRKIRSFIDVVSKKKVTEYLNKEKKKITKLQNHLLKSQAHELRKLLKTFNYNLKILASNKQNKLLQLETLTELLGKWHDGVITVTNLKKAIKDRSINEKEVTQIKKIEFKILSDNTKLFNEIKHTSVIV